MNPTHQMQNRQRVQHPQPHRGLRNHPAPAGQLHHRPPNERHTPQRQQPVRKHPSHHTVVRHPTNHRRRPQRHRPIRAGRMRPNQRHRPGQQILRPQQVNRPRRIRVQPLHHNRPIRQIRINILRKQWRTHHNRQRPRHKCPTNHRHAQHPGVRPPMPQRHPRKRGHDQPRHHNQANTNETQRRGRLQHPGDKRPSGKILIRVIHHRHRPSPQPTKPQQQRPQRAQPP